MVETLEMKGVPEKWKETGRVVHNERVCPDCFNDSERKGRGGGIVKEYTKGQGVDRRYAYRCEQRQCRS